MKLPPKFSSEEQEAYDFLFRAIDGWLVDYLTKSVHALGDHPARTAGSNEVVFASLLVAREEFESGRWTPEVRTNALSTETNEWA